MEPLQVAKMIERCIDALKVEGKRSVELIEAKAQTAANYDLNMGVKSAKHKAGGMAVTLIKEQARADNSELLYDKIIAEETLKAHYCRMDTLKAQMNAYQSINRHLAVT